MEERARKKLVENYEVLKFERNPMVSCKGIVAKMDREIAEVIPVIFLRYIGLASYIPRENILTLRLRGRLVTFYPDGKISINAIWDEEAARMWLDKVKKIINEAYRDILENGEPTKEEIEKALNLSWKNVYEILPKTNCRECGKETCSSFAIEVFRGGAKLSECKPLIEKYYETTVKLREALGWRIMRALGWK